MGFGPRLIRRLFFCLVVLLIVEGFVRSSGPALDQALMRNYRLPDVIVPPVRELAEASARLRRKTPRRTFVGLAGPSTVWGYLVTPDQALSARAQRLINAQGLGINVLNLAMPRNRYADDRMIAGYLAGELDLVLVPFSAYIGSFLEQEACPSHLPIVEWSAVLPDPFPMPAPCQQPERHLVNATLDQSIAHVWRTYDARAALRHLFFSQTSDFGRLVAGMVLNRATSRPKGTVDGQDLPLIERLPADQLPSQPPARMLPEVERLCVAYASRGTRVVFYYMPSASSASDKAQNQALLAGVERSVREVARRHPACSLAELELPAPLFSRDYIDYVHPGERGLDKLSVGLARLIARMSQPPEAAGLR